MTIKVNGRGKVKANGTAPAQPSAKRSQLGQTINPGTSMQDTNFTPEIDSQILHPGSRRLFAHWEALRGERPYPSRDEFTFAPVKDLMADMVIIEQDATGHAYRYRLAGSRACAIFGKNLTASDAVLGWDSFEASLLSTHFERALKDFQPMLARMRFVTDTGLRFAAELIAMPIQVRGSSRVQLIGGLFPFRELDERSHASLRARELASVRAIWTEHDGPGLQAIVDRALAEPRALPAGRPRLRVLAGGKSLH